MTLTPAARPGEDRPTPARPDGARIFELIKDKDPNWGAVARFARRIGCHPQTLRNLKNDPGKGASLDLLWRIAAGLRVDISQIIRAGETPAPEQAPPLGYVA